MQYDKIEIYNLNKNLNFIKYVYKKRKNYPNILISHSSGGITKSLEKLIKICLNNEFNVIIPDHFTSRGVVTQWWHKMENNPSMCDRMIDIIEIHKKINLKLLCGISAGGTAVIMASSHIKVPNFSIYPSTFPLRESLVNSYKTTIITGKNDDWTTLNHAKNLQNYNNCNIIEVPGYHGFMSIGENRFLPECITYKNYIDNKIYKDNFILKDPLNKGVTVKYNSRSVSITLKKFEEFIKNNA